MASRKTNTGLSRKEIAEHFSTLGDQAADRGAFGAAFRFFRKAANYGDKDAITRMADAYALGQGVRYNRELALRLYLRAYRIGALCAATNLAVMYRDECDFRRALQWFERSVKGGDGDANLEIARLHLYRHNNVRAAIPYLERVLKSFIVSVGSEEEATRLLLRLEPTSVALQKQYPKFRY